MAYACVKESVRARDIGIACEHSCRNACVIVTPQTRGSVDYLSTHGIQVDVGLPDTTSENRAESPWYGELYPHTVPACTCPKQQSHE